MTTMPATGAEPGKDGAGSGGVARPAAPVRRMTPQLVVLLTLALLPLGLISVSQSRAVLDEADALSRAALLSETKAAATAERELIYEALGAAQGLSVFRLEDSWEDCRAILSEFVTQHPRFGFAGFATPDGRVVCAGRNQVKAIAGSSSIDRIIEAEGPHVELLARPDTPDGSQVLVSDLARRGSHVVGHVLISIPSRLADALLSDQAAEMGLRLATINAEGQVIAATGGQQAAEAFLPSDVSPARLFDRAGETFEAATNNGEMRFFAVSEIIPGTAAIVGSWPSQRDAGGLVAWRARLWVIFPLLMWLASLAVAVLGLHRLVIRHVFALSRAMTQHAEGRLKGGRIDLKNPPAELRSAEVAFNRMILLLAEAEARQEQDLRDKEVLLREVHHRVKNNLQLIVSIMNMQARKAHGPEVRRILDDLQRRVRGLAVLHRRLYARPETTTVDGAELIEALMDEVGRADADVEVETRLAPVALYPDQAMPLSMLFSEAMTNAVKYVGRPAGGSAKIVVALDVSEDGLVHLSIENTLGAPVHPVEDFKDEGGGLGGQLMHAFVRQLGGEGTQSKTAELYRYDVTFRLQGYSADPADTGVEPAA
ncbi:MAG: sensor histidine kinase [Marinibacterium sp.]